MNEAPRSRKPIGDWHGDVIPPGGRRDVRLPISESYSGMTVRIPLHIRRGPEDGPVVFITAALHGDELNGTGAVRHLLQDESFQIQRGAMMLVPVLNLLAFDRHSRYLPDRRDLNRCFPGSSRGSLANRMARTIFDEIVARCDYGIDLHTAAVRRTNYPTVRGDLSNPGVRRLAEAFGSEIIINARGPLKALRREACKAGCPTIIMEGGEVWKVEPFIVEAAVRGIKNVLCELKMIDGEPNRPDYQVVIERTKWLRSDRGGFLRFHVQPGQIVNKDQPLATNTSLLGREHNTLVSPFAGVVLGMTTLPATSPGEPICHLGMLPEGTRPSVLRRLRREEAGLEGRVVEQLASNVMVVKPTEDNK
jgi:predicted deacylase